MPPRVTIIIETNNTDDGYNRASQLIEAELRNAPTALIDIPISDQEKFDIAYYRTLAEQIARNAPASNVPIGKRVI